MRLRRRGLAFFPASDNPDERGTVRLELSSHSLSMFKCLIPAVTQLPAVRGEPRKSRNYSSRLRLQISVHSTGLTSAHSSASNPKTKSYVGYIYIWRGQQCKSPKIEFVLFSKKGKPGRSYYNVYIHLQANQWSPRFRTRCLLHGKQRRWIYFPVTKRKPS